MKNKRKHIRNGLNTINLLEVASDTCTVLTLTQINEIEQDENIISIEKGGKSSVYPSNNLYSISIFAPGNTIRDYCVLVDESTQEIKEVQEIKEEAEDINITTVGGLSKEVILFLDDVSNVNLKKAFKKYTWSQIANALAKEYSCLGNMYSSGNGGYNNGYFYVYFDSGYSVKVYNKRNDIL